MSVCYNLISCTGNDPDILGVTDSILSGHIDDLVSINGDNTKKYYVRATHQLIAPEIDNTSFLCIGSPVIQYEISSILYNGVEQVLSPQIYNLNISNIVPLTCSGISCTNGICPIGITNYENLSTFLNTVFTLYGIPLQANPIYLPSTTGGYGGVVINASNNDEFTIEIKRTSGPLSPMTYTYGIDNIGNGFYTVNGAYTAYSGVKTDFCLGTDHAISSVTVENICEVVVPCGCPDGYTLSDDGTECTLFESVSATQNPTTYTAALGTFAVGYYGSEAGQFYEDISAKPWPIVATNGPCPIIAGTCSILNDATITPLLVTNLVANTIWGGVTPTTDYRIRVAGIWTTAAPSPVNEWIGFTYCVTLTTTKTYYIAFAVDDFAKFYLDGNLMIDHSGVGWSFRTWKIIPLTLNAGTHIIDGRVLNSGGSATFAFEIYDATLAQLLAVNAVGDIDPYIVFSTKDYIGQTWQTGEVSGYTCPNGYSLNTCDGLVCSRTLTVPSTPCCYLLRDCKTGTLIVTDTDLSSYVGQTIIIEEFEGCFAVEVSVTECIQPQPVTVGDAFISCDQCAPCYTLTNCRDTDLTIKVTNDLLTSIGQIVLVNGDCWTVTEQAPDCVGALPVIITATYDDCYSCLPKCYILTKCDDPSYSVTVTTDLSQYVGQVVHLENCGTTCWLVEETILCEDCLDVVVSESFRDCDTCAPLPPELPEIELHPRKVKPGYDTPGCDPEYTEKVNCKYSDYLYNEVMSKRHGVTICCQEEALKWEIKKNLLDLKTIYDPNMCKSTLNKCCPPSCVESLLYVFQAVACPAPTDVVSVFDAPVDCPEPGPFIRSILTVQPK